VGRRNEDANADAGRTAVFAAPRSQSLTPTTISAPRTD
jgi:hypothetical protein